MLFVINIAWVVLRGDLAAHGLLPRPRRRRPRARGRRRQRTALLMPTYNEDPAPVFGAACAMMRDIHARGAGEAFDLFLLSDTTRADVWLDEQALVDAARADPDIGARIFYRHRGRNLRRKAGNIADWVERWGGAYPFMLVLDADSLMEADCIIELARRMEADETLGILQTSPQLIGGATPLARVQQFASRVYGPVLSRGLRAWFGNAGNYWGHNAIIRTRAFADCGGLPELPGKPPFGGLILSHDFVEAAFVRRGGYAVRMADDLAGSFEHAPPNLDRARRPRPPLVPGQPAARAAPRHRRPASAEPAAPLHGGDVLPRLAALAPLPARRHVAGAARLPGAARLLPRPLVALPRLAAHRPRARHGALRHLHAGALRARSSSAPPPSCASAASRGVRLTTVFGLVAEVLLSALVAPIMMLVQSSAILQILTGRDSGWAAQARDADRVPWPLLWRFHRRHMLAGLLLAVAAGAISWRLLAWMSPALLGLVLAVPLSAFMGSAAAGRGLARLGPPRHPRGAQPPSPRRRRRARGRGAARARRRARGPGRPPRRSRRAGAAPRLARPADRPAPRRARRGARQRAPQARRRLRPGRARRARDLRRDVLARDAREPRAGPALPPLRRAAAR